MPYFFLRGFTIPTESPSLNLYIKTMHNLQQSDITGPTLALSILTTNTARTFSPSLFVSGKQPTKIRNKHVQMKNSGLEQPVA